MLDRPVIKIYFKSNKYSKYFQNIKSYFKIIFLTISSFRKIKIVKEYWYFSFKACCYESAFIYLD